MEHTTVEAAIETLARAQGLLNRPLRLTIRKFNPGGMSGHQTVAVKSIDCGIDWEGDQLIVVPANPLTELSAEDVAAIRVSVSKGTSWHAYQSWKKVRGEADALKAQRDELLVGLEAAFPRGFSAINANVPDEIIVPVDFTMAELRAMSALIAKHKVAV